ncbi:MAG: hypothetical protein KBE65_10785 [Phycisphaerae bacterium]|nr:hypothetical protein [Phycisphaerae bacterium]
MRLHSIRQVLLAGIVLATAGCHTQFSPQWTHHEIERQTGATPEDSFEFKLDGTTMKLAKVAASRVAGEPASLAGLSRIHLAIYELPSGGRLDFNRMRARGWDRVIQTQEGKFGLLVLVRTKGDTLDDLVVFAQGEGRLLYGRQKGKLDRNLPSTLQGVLRTTGLQGLRQRFLSAAEGDATSP